MAYKAAAFLITFILNLIAGAVIFFMMLIAMNGYHESDAQWGLGAYIVLAFIGTMVMSTGAVLAVGLLTKRLYSPVKAALIAIAVFSIIGVVLKIVFSLIGIGVAEFVRVNY